MEDEGCIRRTPVIRANALIFFLLEVRTSCNTELRPKHTKLPPNESIPIARDPFAGYVKLESGKVKSDGLSDRFNVRLLQCEEDTEAF